MQKAAAQITNKVDYQHLLHVNDEFLPAKHKNKSLNFEPNKKFKSEHEMNKLNSPASSTSSSSSSKFSSLASSPSLLQTAGLNEEERLKILSRQAKRPVLKFSMDAILGNNSEDAGKQQVYSSNSSNNSSDYSYQSSPNSTPNKKLKQQHDNETDNKVKPEQNQSPSTYRIQLNYNYMDNPGLNYAFKNANAPLSGNKPGQQYQNENSNVSVSNNSTQPNSMYQIGMG